MYWSSTSKLIYFIQICPHPGKFCNATQKVLNHTQSTGCFVHRKQTRRPVGWEFNDFLFTSILPFCHGIGQIIKVLPSSSKVLKQRAGTVKKRSSSQFCRRYHGLPWEPPRHPGLDGREAVWDWEPNCNPLAWHIFFQYKSKWRIRK